MSTIRRTALLAIAACGMLPSIALADSVWIASNELVEVDIETGETLQSYPEVDAVAFDVNDENGTAWYSDGETLTAVRDGYVIAGPVDVKGVAGIPVSEIVVDDARGRIWAVRGNEVSVFDVNAVELRWWDLSSPYGNNTHVATLEVAPDTGYAWIAQPSRVLHLRADRPWLYGRFWSNWFRIQDIDVVSNGVWIQRYPPADFRDTRLELHSFERSDANAGSGIIAEMSSYRNIYDAIDPARICADENGVWVLGGFNDSRDWKIIYGAIRQEAENAAYAGFAAPDTDYQQEFPVVADAACAADGTIWLAWNDTVAHFGDPDAYFAEVTQRFDTVSPVRRFRVVRD